jgi:hypothetical protein
MLALQALNLLEAGIRYAEPGLQYWSILWIQLPETGLALRFVAIHGSSLRARLGR